MATEIEYKFNAGVEVHEVKADGKREFAGYLACFDNVDSYGDVIVKGAFKETLEEAKKNKLVFPVLEQHGGPFISPDNTPIGYYKELKEDNVGLWAEGVLCNTSRGNDMYTLLKELPVGTMGQSIGYKATVVRRPKDDEIQRGVYRYLLGVKLYEGSLVTFPANDKTRVDNVKSDYYIWAQFENFFRKKGIPANRVEALLNKLLADEDSLKANAERDEKTGGAINVEEVGAKIESFLGSLKDIKLRSDMESLKKTLKGFSLS